MNRTKNKSQTVAYKACNDIKAEVDGTIMKAVMDQCGKHTKEEDCTKDTNCQAEKMKVSDLVTATDDSSSSNNS